MTKLKFRRTIVAGAAVGAALALAAPALAVESNHSDPYYAKDIKSQPASIEGAGSTFAAPLEDSAISTYTNHLNSAATIVAYLALGSGAGESDVLQSPSTGITWGGTDVPLMASDITARCTGSCPGGTTLANFIQAPVGLGGEAMVYNVSGLKFPKSTNPALQQKGLKLTGKVIAEIYNGVITKWNDPQIKALNKGVTGIPSAKIIPVYRADASGTQFIFTNFLQTSTKSTVGCAHCEWPWALSKNAINSYDTPGAGDTSHVPGTPSYAVGGLHNGGVANAILRTRDSIGFVEYSYVLLNPKLKAGVAELLNKAGKYVTPTPGAIAADAAQFHTVSAANYSIVFGPGNTSYPIAGYTWAIVWRHITPSLVDVSSVPSGDTASSVAQYADEVGALTVKYLDWLAHTGTKSEIGGQDIAAQDGYVAMPIAVQTYATNQLKLVIGGNCSCSLINYNP